MMALSHYTTCIVSTTDDTQVVQCKKGGIERTFNNKVYSMDSKKIVKLTAGKNHFCALLEDSTEKYFGKNNSGQLGNGSTSHNSTKRRYFDDS